MSFDEIGAFLKTLESKKKDEWERIRYLCFYNVVSYNGTKQFKKPSELFILPWEKKKKNSTVRKISKEEVEKRKEQASKYIKQVYG